MTVIACLRRRSRHWWQAESGVTLLELTITMVLMGIAAGIFGPLLTSAMNSARATQGQSESIDNLNIAMSAISRELRSAACITSPAENATGTTLDFTTEANNSSYEVIYQVTNGTLTRQIVGVTGTVTEAEKLVNTSDAFKQISTPRRTVVLTFRVQTNAKNTPRVLTTTIAGRNAWRTCPAPL